MSNSGLAPNLYPAGMGALPRDFLHLALFPPLQTLHRQPFLYAPLVPCFTSFRTRRLGIASKHQPEYVTVVPNEFRLADDQASLWV